MPSDIPTFDSSPSSPQRPSLRSKSGDEERNGHGNRPASFFLSIAWKYKPDLLDLMKVSLEAEFSNLKVNTNVAKKKFNCFCVLTPVLVHAIQKTNMTYANIMVAVVEHLKLNIPQSTAAGVTAAPQETKDEILLKIAEPYESILIFCGCVST